MPRITVGTVVKLLVLSLVVGLLLVGLNVDPKTCCTRCGTAP